MRANSLIKRFKMASEVVPHFAGFILILLAAFWLRSLALHPDAILQGYLEIITGLLAFVFAAVALVRFQGTQDRISLILGVGFLLSGTVLTVTSILFFQFFQDAPVRILWAAVAWWVSRMVLALLLVVALVVEHFLPRSRHPRQEIAGALISVVGLTYIITATLRRLPPEVSPHPGAFFPSPQQILPAVIFLISVIWYHRRLKRESAAFDNAIYMAAWLNCAAQLSASQSERLLDAPFALAQGLTMIGYAVALGGALLDNSRLFDQVRHLAVSDPLTGLANYRRLLDVLEKEIERSQRTGRSFSILLLDVDGLKKINDTHGHLVGSRAICRLADILRVNSRAIDTPARYGGDEFVLVLPEAQMHDARGVAQRIQEIMRSDTEQPPVSASIGIAVYRGEGERIEKLLSEADQDLYEQKAGQRKHAAASNGGRK